MANHPYGSPINNRLKKTRVRAPPPKRELETPATALSLPPHPRAGAYWRFGPKMNSRACWPNKASNETQPERMSKSQWAETWYADAPDDRMPLADPDRNGLTNLEEFAMGTEFKEQRASATLGFMIQGQDLVLRFAIKQSVTGINVTPVWKSGAGAWIDQQIATREVSSTENLQVFESRIPLEAGEARFLSVRISLDSVQ